LKQIKDEKQKKVINNTIVNKDEQRERSIVDHEKVNADLSKVYDAIKILHKNGIGIEFKPDKK